MSRSIKMRTVIDRAQDTVRGFLAWGTRREFAFRMRFVVAPRSGISDARERVPLQSSGRMRVVLKAANDKDDLTTSRDWVVEGWGFRNEETAVEAGDRWREVLEIAFAKIRIAADFGDRVPGGGVFTAAGTEWLRKLFGVPQHVPILNDRHGVVAYRRFPRPRFAHGGTLAGSVTVPVSKLQRAVAAARDLACPARSEGERIAYDLFSASFFARDPDARFVLLMMACEALLEPKPRNELVRRCVDDLISLTQTAGLPANDTQSIIGSLRWLYTESIGQAGRRLASGLIPREYMGKHPVHFFTECYALRSALVHGHAERPKAGEVGSHAASLEVFLQDLLSGPLLNLDVAEVEP